MYFGCFCFRGELGFLDCDDISMCVVNKHVELLELVFNTVYVDLKYNEISLIFTVGSVCLCGVCSHEVVPGLSARLSLVAVTVMRVLLFVLYMCMLRECEGTRVTAMLI